MVCSIRRKVNELNLTIKVCLGKPARGLPSRKSSRLERRIRSENYHRAFGAVRFDENATAASPPVPSEEPENASRSCPPQPAQSPADDHARLDSIRSLVLRELLQEAFTRSFDLQHPAFRFRTVDRHSRTKVAADSGGDQAETDHPDAERDDSRH